jgi:aminoglycoside 3-N-acetyltransferase
VQPDKEIGTIAHRLCSWPSSRRSEHPAYSFVAVGYRGDDAVHDFSPEDPLLPVRKFLKHDPVVLTIGVGLNAVTSIHLAEEKFLPQKFSRERALTVSSKGQSWIAIRSIGCSHGFEKLRSFPGFVQGSETNIGFARAVSYSMKRLTDSASSMLKENNLALLCDRANCLSCSALA